MRTEHLQHLVTSDGYMDMTLDDKTALAEFRKMEVLGLHHASQIINPDLRMYAKSVINLIQDKLGERNDKIGTS